MSYSLILKDYILLTFYYSVTPATYPQFKARYYAYHLCCMSRHAIVYISVSTLVLLIITLLQ